MRYVLSILVFVFTSILSYSQATPHYDYDAAGNRISRTMIVKAMEDPDRIEDEEETVDNRTPDEELFDSAISVYPNPTYGFINVEIPTDKLSKATDAEDLLELTIIDHAGKQILKQTVQDANNRINLTDVAVGKYILQINSNSITQSWQIIKN